ncbi:MAG: LuxR C-terminal-related transcriptional regulator [Egibacteraceae bacterium]
MARHLAQPLTDPRPGHPLRRPEGRLLRVMVVAATRLYRDGLVTLLGTQPDIELVASEEEGVTAVVRAGELHPDVVLLDMSDPHSTAIARRLSAGDPPPCVVGVAVPDEESEVLRCATAGLAAYVPCTATLDDLLDTLRRMHGGQSLRAADVAAVLGRQPPPDALGSQLTAREVEIVRLIDQSLSNREIAQRLGITVSTVKNHVHNVLRKLGARRRGEAAAWLRALRAQSVSPAGVP